VSFDASVDALKKAAQDIGTEAVLGYLITVAPWVRLPIFSALARWLVGYVLDVAINKTELGVFFVYIDVRTSAQGRAFAKAALKHRKAMADGTAKERAAAEADLVDAFRQFARFTS